MPNNATLITQDQTFNIFTRNSGSDPKANAWYKMIEGNGGWYGSFISTTTSDFGFVVYFSSVNPIKQYVRNREEAKIFFYAGNETIEWYWGLSWGTYNCSVSIVKVSNTNGTVLRPGSKVISGDFSRPLFLKTYMDNDNIKVPSNTQLKMRILVPGSATIYIRKRGPPTQLKYDSIAYVYNLDSSDPSTVSSPAPFTTLYTNRVSDISQVATTESYFLIMGSTANPLPQALTGDTFEIVFTQQVPQQLVDNTVSQGIVSYHTYNDYYFDVPGGSDTRELYIRARRIGRYGKLVLLINCSTIPDKNQFLARDPIDNIEDDEESYAGLVLKNPAPCRYYISIYGLRTGLNQLPYQLLLSSTHVNYLDNNEGAPEVFWLHPGQWADFAVTIGPEASNLYISLNDCGETAQLFLSKTLLKTADSRYLMPDTVSVRSPDAGIYYIGVLSTITGVDIDPNSQQRCSIIANYEYDTPLLLSNSYSGTLEKGAWRDFVLTVDGKRVLKGKSVTFKLEKIGTDGYLSLFVNHTRNSNSLPTQRFNISNATTVSIGADVNQVTLSSVELGNYFVSVFATKPSSFKLTVDYTDPSTAKGGGGGGAVTFFMGVLVTFIILAVFFIVLGFLWRTNRLSKITSVFGKSEDSHRNYSLVTVQSHDDDQENLLS